MSYMSQELKSSLAPAIKAVLKKYGMKGSIAVRHHSTLVVNLQEGELQFEQHSVNPYSIKNYYSGDQQAFLLELSAAMSKGNHDNSDLQSDYFDVGWYISINIGQWNKPYVFLGEVAV